MTDAASPTKPIKLTTARDYFNATAHLAVTAGIMTGAMMMVSPTAAILSAVFGGGLVIGGSKLLGARMKGDKKEELKPINSPRLPDMVDDLTKRAGLKEKPVIYDMLPELDTIKDTTTAPQLRRVLNAAALDVGKPVIMISQPLLIAMTDDETKAVLAHEFTHLAARHSPLRMAASAMHATAMGAAMAILGHVALASALAGWGSTAVFFGVGIAGSKLIKKWTRKKEDGVELPQAKQARRGIYVLQEAAMTSFLVATNPLAALTAIATELAVFWSSTSATRSFSRRNEFQADRGAVALGADPLALMTALRKMEAAQKRDKPQNSAWADYHQGSLLVRLYKRIETLNRTHPNTERRCKALAAIAKKQGRSPEDIAAALTGPVDISKVPPATAEDNAQIAAMDAKKEAESKKFWKGVRKNIGDIVLRRPSELTEKSNWRYLAAQHHTHRQELLDKIRACVDETKRAKLLRQFSEEAEKFKQETGKHNQKFGQFAEAELERHNLVQAIFDTYYENELRTIKPSADQGFLIRKRLSTEEDIGMMRSIIPQLSLETLREIKPADCTPEKLREHLQAQIKKDVELEEAKTKLTQKDQIPGDSAEPATEPPAQMIQTVAVVAGEPSVSSVKCAAVVADTPTQAAPILPPRSMVIGPQNPAPPATPG